MAEATKAFFPESGNGGMKEWRNVHCDGVKLRGDSYLQYKRKTQEGNEGF